jgi:hypothetical protein
LALVLALVMGGYSLMAGETAEYCLPQPCADNAECVPCPNPPPGCCPSGGSGTIGAVKQSKISSVKIGDRTCVISTDCSSIGIAAQGQSLKVNATTSGQSGGCCVPSPGCCVSTPDGSSTSSGSSATSKPARQGEA